MSVSRNLVDGILITGLIIGTLGVLCLAYGFLGKRGQRGLRVLLLVVGVGALFALVLTEFAVFAGHDISVPSVLAGSAIYGVFFTTALGRDTDGAESWWEAIVGALLGIVGVAALAGLAAVVLRSGAWVTLALAGGLIAGAVLVVCVLRLILIRMSEPRLRVIGVLFTLVGMASQALALGLDLSKVKIL